MAMVSFGHPVQHQDAKEKPLQTHKKTNRRGRKKLWITYNNYKEISAEFEGYLCCTNTEGSIVELEENKIQSENVLKIVNESLSMINTDENIQEQNLLPLLQAYYRRSIK